MNAIRRQYEVKSINFRIEFLEEINLMMKKKLPTKIVLKSNEINSIFYIRTDNNKELRSIMVIDLKGDKIIIRSFVGEINDFHYILHFLVKSSLQTDFKEIIYICRDDEKYIEIALDHDFYYLRHDDNFYYLCKELSNN